MSRRPRLWLSFLCFMLLAPFSVRAIGAQGPGGLPTDLEGLIAEALKDNPEIKQMADLSQAAKETVRSSGALDDPDFLFSLKDVPTNTWSLSQDDMTQKMFMLSQKVPFPGKRRLRSEVAASQAQTDTFLVQDKVREVRAKVIQSYWGLSVARSAFDITKRNKELWEQVVQVAESRYAAGQGMQADVLQAQVELGGYLDRQLQWQQRQESARADLNALRGKPPQTPLPNPAVLKPRPFPFKLEELLALTDGNPKLQALKTGVEKQERAVSLAKKDYLPDFTFQVAYGLRENKADLKRPDMFTSSVMMNLPIWQASKIKPKIREEQAKESAVREAHQAALNQLQAAIKDRHAKLVRLSQQSALYERGIIPQARQAAQAALAAYRVGSLDFARLSQNFIALSSAELQWQEYLKDFEEVWAELEWLVGQELPRSPGGRQ
jgi:outer membrane protein TolC